MFIANKKEVMDDSHFENSISSSKFCLLRSAAGQNGADVLQWSVELTVDAAQLSSFAYLALHIESESCI